MSDTTPTPRPDESTPLAEETEREHGTGEQPVVRSSDPADHTDTAAAPTVPPGYDPVAASGHVAPGETVDGIATDREATDASARRPARESAASPGAPVEPTETADDEPRRPADESTENSDEQRAADAPRPSPEDSTQQPAEELAQQPAGAPASESAAATPAPTPAPTPARTPEATPAAPGYTGPTYLNAPERPKKRSNRGLGILIAVLATVVFAAANLAATYGVLVLRYGDTKAIDFAKTYVQGWDFWLPVAVFAAAFIALVAIVNRGRWAAYVFGSIFVAALVFIAYFVAAMLTSRMWEKTADEFRSFTGDYFQSNVPYLWIAVIATFIALEVVIWFGAWVAFHGQNAKRRNIAEQAAWDEEYAIPADR